MLTTQTGFDDAVLKAIRALEQEVVAHDGGRLKLELEYVQDHPIDLVLAHEGDRLVAYAGRYVFGGGSTPEIAGMVAPGARRKGIGSQLLAALGGSGLLVVPTTTPAGRAFAISKGATLDHSEHFLVLGATPSGQPVHDGVSIRMAAREDLQTVRDLLRSAFDWEPPTDVLDRPDEATRLIELDGVAVGTLRVNRHGSGAGIYGFAVDPRYQGRGIGRDVLARTCRELRDQGVQRVTLEVETRNENALRLYTSTGFVREAGEDYWALTTS